MADDFDEAEGGGAYAVPYLMQPTTTPEAQEYARKILDKSISGTNYTDEENSLVDQLQKSSSEATQALRSARARLAAQNFDQRRVQLAMASGLASPTRSGSFGESFGRAFGNVNEELAAQQQFEQGKSQQELGYDVAIPEQEQAVTKARLSLAQLHDAQQAGMARAALSTLGRSIVPGQGMISPNWKIAASEGLQPGTPQFLARVKFLDDQDVHNKSATAGTDTGVGGTGDRSKIAYQYGVPVDDSDPWAGISTKERQQAMRVERQEDLKTLDKDDSGILQTQQTDRDVDRFLHLNKDHPTGRLQGVPGAKFLTSFPASAIEMDKISSRLGPLMRQPGMGRMTNYDLQVFMQSVLGRDKPYNVNQDIGMAIKIANANQRDWNEFQHNYFAVNRNLRGARNAWDRYLMANPIFDPKAPAGSYTLNPHRSDYKTYFRSLMEQPSAGHAAGGAVQKFAGGGKVQAMMDAAKALLGHKQELDRAIDALAVNTRKVPIPHAAANQLNGAYMGALDAHDTALQAPTAENIANMASKVQQVKQLAAPHVEQGFAGGGSTDTKDTGLKDLLRSLEQGALFQWGDEANAAARPGPYARNVGQERTAIEDFGHAHPYTDFGLQGVGGAATGYAAAKGLQTLGSHLRGKPGKIADALALLDRLAPRGTVRRIAGVGAGAGALAGAGAAQTPGQVPEMATTQGALNAVLGPLSGLAAKYGVRGALAIKDLISKANVPAGVQRVLSALERDKMTPASVTQRLAATKKLGVPATVADVGGPNTQALAAATAARPGPASAAVTDALKARNMGANDRVQELVNKALKPDTYQDKLDELTTALYHNAKPLYDKAYAAFPSLKSDKVEEILATPSGKKAARAAIRLMQDSGVSLGQGKAASLVNNRSLQYLDYVKKGLDDMISKEEVNGSTAAGRSLRDLRNRLRDELDTATTDKNGNSPYVEARQQYGGDREVLDALKLGREQFGKLTPAQLATATQNMSYAEKDALRTGVAEYLFNQVGNVPYTSNPATRLANVPNVAKKLQVLFDSQKEYTNFMASLQSEMLNYQRAQGAVSAAARGRTREAADDLSGHAANFPVGEAAYEATIGAAGHPAWVGARAARWLANRAMLPNTSDRAAVVLGINNQGSYAADLARLQAQAAHLSSRATAGNTAATAGAAGAAAASAPNPWGQTPEEQSAAGQFDQGGSVSAPGLTSMYSAMGMMGPAKSSAAQMAAQLAYMQAMNPEPSNDIEPEYAVSN